MVRKKPNISPSSEDQVYLIWLIPRRWENKCNFTEFLLEQKYWKKDYCYHFQLDQNLLSLRSVGEMVIFLKEHRTKVTAFNPIQKEQARLYLLPSPWTRQPYT